MRTFACALLGAAVMLGACSREPDFDERYEQASRTIVDRAKAIDAQITATGAPPVDADAGASVEDDPLLD